MKPTEAQRKFMLRIAEFPGSSYHEQFPNGAHCRMRNSMLKNGWIVVSTANGYDITDAGQKALIQGERIRQKNVMQAPELPPSARDLPRRKMQAPQLNDRHRDVKKALKLYTEFREAQPERGRQIELEMPKVLMVLGNVRFIGYDTTRRGKTELYKHDFAAGSRPILCADGETGKLFIIEGRYHVTPRGIVDLDPKGKEIDD